ncbi:hypothetical protein JCM8097_002441 [Rhodosporidiobolus ruineniae]
MPVTLLTSPPPALSRDELASLSSSTPTTFTNIPPLTRQHLPEGVTISVDPPLEGFNGQGLTGALWVTEDALSFFDNSHSQGISIPYPHITLHAVSRSGAPQPNGAADAGEGAQARPCIYCQFEEEQGAEEKDDYDGSGSREVWITPGENGDADALFSTLTYCSSLHAVPSSSSPSSALPSVLSAGESSSHFNGPNPSVTSSFSSDQAALFASMGLDPDSMVFAGPNGELQGPGAAALLAQEAEEGQFEDDDEEEVEEQHERGGRQRSDFVNPGRARGAPY